jgi:hypothetical protein
MDTQSDKPRYNKVVDRFFDDGRNVSQRLFEKYLLHYDAYVEYKNGILKISYRPKLRNDPCNTGKTVRVPKNLLRYCWEYYELPTYKYPKDNIRFYIMFKNNGKEVVNI